jgi:integrase
MLSTGMVKAARPRAAAYKLNDGGGLHLYVTPKCRMSWRWRFYWEGKEQLLTIGRYPDISLDQARAARDQARERLDHGEDPRVCEIAQTHELRAFEYIARAWHAHMLDRWTPVHAADVLASLERDVFPLIGDMPIGAITEPVVLNVVHQIESRGKVVTGGRVRQRMSRVFRFAKAQGLISRDPAADVDDMLALAPPVRNQSALIEMDEVRELLAAAELVDVLPAVRLASQFIALTAARLGAIRQARWEEIEDLDEPMPQWRIPAANMKQRAAKKLDPTNDHVVPLSRQAADVLRQARDLAGGPELLCSTDLIFEGRDGISPIAEGAIGAIYKRAGYAGRHVPHGWRASFSSILNVIHPEHRAAIDKALGHVGDGKEEKDAGINRKVEAAYNRSGDLPAHVALRARLFQAWADALDGAAAPAIAAAA